MTFVDRVEAGRQLSKHLGYYSNRDDVPISGAARLPVLISAIVSRGRRPDLAGASLSLVRAPVLLIVGGNNEIVLG